MQEVGGGWEAARKGGRGEGEGGGRSIRNRLARRIAAHLQTDIS